MNNRIINSINKIIEMERLAGAEEIVVANRKKVPARGWSASGGKVKIENPKVQAGFTNLDEIREKAAKCSLCSLAKTRTNVVPGEGDPRAKLMFIGEAPGSEEDAQGRPFVGKAGQLLTKIIASIGLKREEVFIANILKCRPPGNRNPLPTEIMKCSPYLKAQVRLIKPKVICALGKFAAQTLLQTETPISRLRGTFHEYEGVKLMPTYHPAYLLRNPGGKKDVWKDMKKVAKELGIKIP